METTQGQVAGEAKTRILIGVVLIWAIPATDRIDAGSGRKDAGERVEGAAISRCLLLGSHLTPNDSSYPVRPGFGTLGTAITLSANVFPITLPRDYIYEYFVDIFPKPVGAIRRRLYQLLEESPVFAPHLDYIAHDQSARLVAARQLPQPLSIVVQTFTISITETTKLNMDELQRYVMHPFLIAPKHRVLSF
jgi:hypothetical protein